MAKEDVDARHKAGHDEIGFAVTGFLAKVHTSWFQ